MFPKILQYDGHFEHTGEARCQILDRRDRRLYKHASVDTLDYLDTVQSEEGRTIVLVLAMSSGEYYGPNRNGDAFSEKPVMVGNTWAVAPGETLPDSHKTFEEHATVYKHHVNKDPLNNYGDVLQSFYNWNMHRVELLLSVYNDRAGDIVGRIDGGEFPGVSMGCRIKYDVCSICGNQAPTRAEYCHHVNGMDPRYGMNKLMPDGQRCYVWNPSPVLFDISFVFKPADRIGFMMKKVAGFDPYEIRSSAVLGERVQRLSEKRALLQKMSDIDKVIEGSIVNTDGEGAMPPAEVHATEKLVDALRAPTQDSPTVSMHTMHSIKHHSLPEFASSFSALGMLPMPQEIFRFICAQNGMQSDPHIEEQLSRSQGNIANMMKSMPQILDQLANMGLLKLSSADVRSDIVNAIAPLQEKRALWQESLARKYIPESIGPAVASTGAFDAEGAYYTPTWQPLTWQDPESGREYETTRRAAERADLSNTKKELVEAAGIAGMLGVGYKAITSKHKALAAPLLAGGAYLGSDLVGKQRMPTVMTSEGIAVPQNTEFVEKRSNALRQVGTPLVGGALLAAALLSERAASEAPRELAAPMQFLRDNPRGTTVGSIAAASGLQHLAQNALKKAASADPTSLDPVDMSEIFLRIGDALLR